MIYIDHECDCSDTESVNTDSSFINDGDISEKSWTSINSSESSKIDQQMSDSDDSYESSFIDDNSDVSVSSSELMSDDSDVDEAVENTHHVREPYKMSKNYVRKMLESDTVRYIVLIKKKILT